MKITEVYDTLKVIAGSIGGADVSTLPCKGQKERMADHGYVFPKYGGLFKLTPVGKKWAEESGVQVAPFASWSEQEMVDMYKKDIIQPENSKWDLDRLPEIYSKCIGKNIQELT